MAVTRFISKEGEVTKFESQEDFDKFTLQRALTEGVATAGASAQARREQERILRGEGVTRGEITITKSGRRTKTETVVRSAIPGSDQPGEIISREIKVEGPVIEGKQPTRAQVTGTEPRRLTPILETARPEGVEVLKQLTEGASPLEVAKRRTITGEPVKRKETVETRLEGAEGEGFLADLQRSVSRITRIPVSGQIERIETDIERSEKREKELRAELSGLQDIPGTRGAIKRSITQFQIFQEQSEQFFLGGDVGALRRVSEKPLSVAGDVALALGLGVGLKGVQLGASKLAGAFPSLPATAPFFKGAGAVLSKITTPAIISLASAQIITTPGDIAEKGETAGKLSVRLASFGVGARLSQPFVKSIQTKIFEQQLRNQADALRRAGGTFQFDPTKELFRPTDTIRIEERGGRLVSVRETERILRGEPVISRTGAVDPRLRQFPLQAGKEVQQLRAFQEPSLGTKIIDPSVQTKLGSEFKDPIVRLESGRFIIRQPDIRITFEATQEQLGESILRSRTGIRIIRGKGGQLRSLFDLTPESFSLFDDIASTLKAGIPKFPISRTGALVPGTERLFVEGGRLASLLAVGDLRQAPGLKLDIRPEVRQLPGLLNDVIAETDTSLDFDVLTDTLKLTDTLEDTLKKKGKRKSVSVLDPVSVPDLALDTVADVIEKIQEINKAVPIASLPSFATDDIQTGLDFVLPGDSEEAKRKTKKPEKAKKKPTKSLFQQLFGVEDVGVLQEKGISEITGLPLRDIGGF